MKKKVQDTISRIKFSLESRIKLRLGVKNKTKPENQKETKISVLNHQKNFSKKKSFIFLVFDIIIIKNDMQNDYYSQRYILKIFALLDRDVKKKTVFRVQARLNR